jgi:Mg/Co/Ni transporter MgtE
MPILKQRLFAQLQSPAGEGTDGGGGTGAPASITPELQTLINAEIEKSVAGLKSKNSELLGKLKDAGDNLKRFDGIDPTAVRSILKRFTDDEEASLIAKGEVDTVLNRRTERMKAEYDRQLKERDEKTLRAEQKATRLAQRTLAPVHPPRAAKA